MRVELDRPKLTVYLRTKISEQKMIPVRWIGKWTAATSHVRSAVRHSVIVTATQCKKGVRWGYSSELRRLSVLLHEADAQLFRKMINNKEHCIHQLLPPEKILPMKLRAYNCIFALPQCDYNLYKRSFVLRSLFEDAY